MQESWTFPSSGRDRTTSYAEGAYCNPEPPVVTFQH